MKLYSNVIDIPKRHADAGFENFKINDENRNQVEICKNWDGQSSIFLTGNPGTGKTHLAIAMLRNYPMFHVTRQESIWKKEQIENEIRWERGDKAYQEKLKTMLDEELWKYRPAKCCFVPLVELFIELNEVAQKEEGKKKYLDRYAGSYDCICFDDFGSEKLTEAKRENFYYIIDKRYREMRSTLVTSNFTIKEINEVEPRIASRFAEMGKILQFNGSDYRRKMKN